MQAPEDVVIALRNIRPTFEMRYNRTAKVIGGASFDVNGNPRKLEFEPRWELWDTDESGREYKVATLQGKEGEFLPPGMWFVDFIRLVDPARYDGDVKKMIDALVDSPNREAERLDEKTFEEVTDDLANKYWHQERVTQSSLSSAGRTPSFMEKGA